jgi:hypothetical protein
MAAIGSSPVTSGTISGMSEITGAAGLEGWYAARTAHNTARTIAAMTKTLTRRSDMGQPRIHLIGRFIH